MEKIRYHLIGNSERGDSLEMLRNLPWKEGTVMCTQHTWVWTIYCRLKMRGANVSFGYTPSEGAINIIHGQVARRILQPADFDTYFIIGIRADYHSFPYGHFEIVQNQRTAGGRRIFIPLFPQPGLLSRDAERAEVHNVCFSGRDENSLPATELENELNKEGIQFVYKGVGEWQNMTDVDVLLGIRSLTKKRYNNKPATKLFNAWLAGIPFIGGYDSAYVQVGDPGKNYLRVSSYPELFKAIRLLKDNPDVYRSMVEEGQKAAIHYTAEKTAERWEQFLDGPATDAYRKWENGQGLVLLGCAFRRGLFRYYEKGLKVVVYRILKPLRNR